MNCLKSLGNKNRHCNQTGKRSVGSRFLKKKKKKSIYDSPYTLLTPACWAVTINGGRLSEKGKDADYHFCYEYLLLPAPSLLWSPLVFSFLSFTSPLLLSPLFSVVCTHLQTLTLFYDNFMGTWDLYRYYWQLSEYSKLSCLNVVQQCAGTAYW